MAALRSGGAAPKTRGQLPSVPFTPTAWSQPVAGHQIGVTVNELPRAGRLRRDADRGGHGFQCRDRGLLGGRRAILVRACGKNGAGDRCGSPDSFAVCVGGFTDECAPLFDLAGDGCPGDGRRGEWGAVAMPLRVGAPAQHGAEIFAGRMWMRRVQRRRSLKSTSWAAGAAMAVCDISSAEQGAGVVCCGGSVLWLR
jgi:hypothetical protein